MNYKSAQNPEFVNECILEYIDYVMAPDCETQKEDWTLDKIVSWERFGSSICRKCSENKDKLAPMIHDFKAKYDVCMTKTTESYVDTEYMPKMDRKTTPYKDVYYKIRSKIEEFGMNNLFLNCCAKENCVNNKGNYWTPDIIFNVGEMLFTCNEKIFIPKCEPCKHNWSTISLKIDILVLESNMELLEKRNTYNMELLTHKIESYRSYLEKLKQISW
jgi:hypothetical protein